MPRAHSRSEPQHRTHRSHKCRAARWSWQFWHRADAVAVLCSGAVVGYIFCPARRKEMKNELRGYACRSRNFPKGETRLATYRISVRPWDATRAMCLAGCGAFRRTSCILFITARIWAARAMVIRNRIVHVPCHGGAYIRWQACSGPPPSRLFEYDTKLQARALDQSPADANARLTASGLHRSPKRCSCSY